MANHGTQHEARLRDLAFLHAQMGKLNEMLAAMTERDFLTKMSMESEREVVIAAIAKLDAMEGIGTTPQTDAERVEAIRTEFETACMRLYLSWNDTRAVNYRPEVWDALPEATRNRVRSAVRTGIMMALSETEKWDWITRRPAPPDKDIWKHD